MFNLLNIEDWLAHLPIIKCKNMIMKGCVSIIFSPTKKTSISMCLVQLWNTRLWGIDTTLGLTQRRTSVVNGSCNPVSTSSLLWDHQDIKLRPRKMAASEVDTHIIIIRCPIRISKAFCDKVGQEMQMENETVVCV